MAAKSQRSVAPLSNAESDREGASARTPTALRTNGVHSSLLTSCHARVRSVSAFIRAGGPSRYSLTDADCKFLVERRNGDSFVQRRVEKHS